MLETTTEHRQQPVAHDPTIIGTQCDDRKLVYPLLPQPLHEGCPGWWGKSTTDEHALTCACPCHVEAQRWPHWEQQLAHETQAKSQQSLL